MSLAAFRRPPEGLLISCASDEDVRPRLALRSRGARRRSALARATTAPALASEVWIGRAVPASAGRTPATGRGGPSAASLRRASSRIGRCLGRTAQ